MDARCLLLVVFIAGPAIAQTQTAKGAGVGRITSTPQAAHNSMAKSVTPYECDIYKAHPDPRMVKLCQGFEASMLQAEAHRAGRPGPSAEVVSLPGIGTPEAKASGVACIGGQAMRKLSNGWAQMSSSSGGWQRCRER